MNSAWREGAMARLYVRGSGDSVLKTCGKRNPVTSAPEAGATLTASWKGKCYQGDWSRGKCD